VLRLPELYPAGADGAQRAVDRRVPENSLVLREALQSSVEDHNARLQRKQQALAHGARGGERGAPGKRIIAGDGQTP
jgi:hypothetical protein